MTKREGKDFLKDCMEKCGVKENFDNIFLYKTGNRKSADSYQSDEITAEVSDDERKRRWKYIVKCFIYLDIYVIWNREVGEGSGKYRVYKGQLSKLSEQKDSIAEVSVPNGHAYLFYKSEKLAKDFITKYVLE
jgi:hypothetical protein